MLRVFYKSFEHHTVQREDTVMLDRNITLVFQLVNFFIALYVLNLLLIRPIREIIRKRKAVMDDMSGESESYD